MKLSNPLPLQYYWKLSNPRDQRELDNQFKKQREDLLDEEGPVKDEDIKLEEYERVRSIDSCECHSGWKV